MIDVRATPDRCARHTLDRLCWLRSLQAVLAATTDVEHNTAHPYTDGDQSFVPNADMPDQPNYQLRHHWSQGFNFNPGNFRAWNAPLFTCCYVGDAAGVRELLQSADTPEKKRRLVERRVSGLRMSPLLTLICGCRDPQAASAYAPRGRTTGRYEECLQLLLEAHARPTCRDVCGYTAIHHCTTCISRQRTWDMVPTLIRYGANPNVCNRFNVCPLFEGIQSRNLGAVEALALAGADPSQRVQHSPAALAFGAMVVSTPMGIARMSFPEAAACMSTNAGRVRERQAAVQGRRCTLQGESACCWLLVALLVTLLLGCHPAVVHI